MPRSAIDWKSTESYTRLLAAMVAANDLKLNYKKIADFYGNGATYDSIEGRFRIIRKEAEKLKTEIDTGARAPAPARSTNSTPRKNRAAGNSFEDAGVRSGRVTKSANNTPMKKRTSTMKKDLLESSASSATSGQPNTDFHANPFGDMDHSGIDQSFLDGALDPNAAHNPFDLTHTDQSHYTEMDPCQGDLWPVDEEQFA